MSRSPRSSRWGYFQAAPKKPPPERGIRMKKAGTTWWGRRWIAALEGVLRGDAGRLTRGRAYARAGRVHDLVIKGGRVTARATGSAPKPYTITIALTELDAAAWQKAIARLAKKAQFSAELLANQMPKAIDEVFAEAGLSLFPNQREELETHCSCPDWGEPCKHVAAAHYVLGEALDRDPFLLFELRGRTREQVLDALRSARGGGEARGTKDGKASGAPATESAEVPTVVLGRMRASTYDAPRAPLPDLRFSFDEPSASVAILRQLGQPTSWQGDASPADVLAPLVRAAALEARRIAMAPQGETDATPPASKTPHDRCGARRLAKRRGRRSTR